MKRRQDPVNVNFFREKNGFFTVRRTSSLLNQLCFEWGTNLSFFECLYRRINSLLVREDGV